MIATEIPAPATLAAIQAAIRGADVGERVLLILPDHADELASEVPWQVIRRQADDAEVQVGVVSADPDIRYFAKRARIPVYKSREQAQRRWRWPRADYRLPAPHVARPFLVTPPRQVGRGVAAPVIVTLGDRTLIHGKTRDKPRRWWLSALGYLLVIGLVAAALYGFALYVVPQATVTLVPARTQLVSSVEISAKVGVEEPEYLNKVIPARVVQARVEGFATTETTGSTEAPVGKATGQVTFINRTAREIVVPANTIVRTATGNNVRFRVVDEEVRVPPGIGQRASAAIEAVEPGREGNVPALTISEIEGPLNISLRVSNPEPTAGGAVETVAVVTQADKDRLLGQLQADLQRQAYSKLGESLRQGEFIPPETVTTFTLAETYDRFAGEHSPVLGLQLQLLARGLAVDMDAAEQMALRTLRESVPEGHFLLEETIRTGQPTFLRFDDEGVDLTMTASGLALIPIKPADVRSLIAGATPEEAVKRLEAEFDLATRPQITIEPDWLGRVPYIPTRIRVRVLQEGE
ncbi:MAG: hypothetical protein GXP42_02960 [Chloroflexi bacterium]|nr:hypothetical protein [Chloroflexota bacterium]